MANRSSPSDKEEPVGWDELQALRKNWEELARRVSEMESRAAQGSVAPPVLNFGESKLREIAISIFSARQRRLELFDKALFGEPSWDLLLTAFIAKTGSTAQSTTELCRAAGVPLATGLRWIEHLKKQGLLQRVPSPHDARVSYVELTETGHDLMRRYILDGITRFSMPLPDA